VSDTVRYGQCRANTLNRPNTLSRPPLGPAITVAGTDTNGFERTQTDEELRRKSPLPLHYNDRRPLQSPLVSVSIGLCPYLSVTASAAQNTLNSLLYTDIRRPVQQTDSLMAEFKRNPRKDINLKIF
jgi:hypothetical protein